MYFLVEDCANGIWEDEKLPSVRFSSKVWLTLLLLVPLCHLLEITERRSFHFSTMLEWVVGNVKKKKKNWKHSALELEQMVTFGLLLRWTRTIWTINHLLIISLSLLPWRKSHPHAGCLCVLLVWWWWIWSIGTEQEPLRLLRVLAVLETLPSEFF